MRFQRIAIAVTAVNLAILIVALVLVVRPEVSPETASVLRGRSLEIVDAQGEVRAQIIIQPAETAQDGKFYAETVLFRLIDPDGMPGVKLGSSADGSGLLLARNEEQSRWSGVQILSEESGGILRVVSKSGQEQVIQP